LQPEKGVPVKAQFARPIERLPDHEYAHEHKLLKARHEHSTSKRRLRDAAHLRPSGEVACERVRELMWDLGAELDWTRWVCEVSRQIGINERTGQGIASCERLSISTQTVDAIARHTGIPVRVFYDPEL
jgi:hypothetical protein